MLLNLGVMLNVVFDVIELELSISRVPNGTYIEAWRLYPQFPKDVIHAHCTATSLR